MAFLIILKFIGVLLLCILCILLLLLIVPIRYSINGGYKEKMAQGEAGVYWLLHFVSLKMHAGPDNNVTGILKILFFRIKEFNKSKEAEETAKTEEAMAQVQKPLNTPYDDSGFIKEEKKEADTEIITETETVEESSKPEDAVGIKEEPAATDKAGIFDKLHSAYELLSGESAKKSVNKVLNRVFKILKSVLPRKGKGYLTFGTDDPYRTGEILEVLAFLYPLYGGIIDVTPDFLNTLFEGELSVKGRIFLGKVLFEAALIYFNKPAKQLFNDLKEVFA